MSKNILVISTSLREKSNSEALANSFMAGAEAAGNHAEKITLKEKHIAFCRGCLACQQTQRCVIQDDAVELAEKMCHADVIVFATPVYYYGMSGQLKTLLDRANALFASQYAFRKIYLLMTAAEDGAHVPEKTISGINGWIDCFDQAVLAGTVFAGGVTAAGEIAEHSALQEAYRMGNSI